MSITDEKITVYFKGTLRRANGTFANCGTMSKCKKLLLSGAQLFKYVEQKRNDSCLTQHLPLFLIKQKARLRLTL